MVRLRSEYQLWFKRVTEGEGGEGEKKTPPKKIEIVGGEGRSSPDVAKMIHQHLKSDVTFYFFLKYFFFFVRTEK